MTRSIFNVIAIAILALIPAACGSPPSLMRTPAIYAENVFDLSTVTRDDLESNVIDVFYATDRAYDPDRQPDPYPPKRARALRLGASKVRIGPEDWSWNKLVEESVAWPRRNQLRMRLDEVDDFGPLDQSVIFFDTTATDPNLSEPAVQFAQQVNKRLESSRSKNIYVYVAPFKVSFEQSIIVAAEFYYYMGQDGVFVVYSWPTRRGTFDYLSSTENAYQTLRHFRIFVDYLARATSAEHIHFLSYSAGARVLSGGLQQLRLKYSGLSESEVKEKLRIGQVVFTGPDIDRGAFLSHYADGLADLADQITIYTTKRDRALGMSRFLFGWGRLGSLDADDFRPNTIEHLERDDQTSFVRVSDAERANEDNGHGYFRASPWVSSDILMTLVLGLPPSKRGLIREGGDPIWRFPHDYRENIVRLADDARREQANFPDSEFLSPP